MNIKNFLQEKSSQQISSCPVILDLQNKSDEEKMLELESKGLILSVRDDYKEQLKEYFAIMNPPLIMEENFEEKFDDYLSDLEKRIPIWQQGRYVYYPWIFTLVHILEDEAFQIVRTARNKNLVNDSEQKKFYDGVIGIAGLTIGNSAALAIVLQGGGKHIKLADFDRLALTNLNRIRSGINDLGLTKVEMTARQIYLINPYTKIELFPEGLTPDNITNFMEGSSKIDIMVDEIDQFHIKFLMREHAKRLKIPVVFAVDNGNNGLVDIERYDLENSTEFFHNRLEPVSYEEFSKLDKWGICKAITEFVGPENISLRMKQSLAEMGKTLIAWPRLGGATLLNGSIVAYCVRKILNNEPLENNRGYISLDKELAPDFKTFGGISENFDAWFNKRNAVSIKPRSEKSQPSENVPEKILPSLKTGE